MTQDFKDKILDYITNNVSQQSGQNTPQIPSPTLVPGNVKNYITNKLSDAQGINLLGTLTSETNDNIIYYGYYSTTSNKYYGFIYIVDKNIQEVKFITTFSSGNKLFPIVSLNQDENNYIYALALDYDGLTKGRVLLLNNIFGNYNVILRNSYIIPNNYEFSRYTSKSIVKVLNEATYYIVAQEINGGTKIIKFTINVGMENDWIVYSLNGDKANLINYDVLIEKENNNIIYHLYTIDQTYSTLTYNTYAEYKIENDIVTREKFITFNHDIFIFSSYVVANTINEIYIGTYTNQDGYFRIKRVSDNDFIEIFNFLNPNTYYTGTISMKKVNGIVLLYYGYSINSDKYGKVGIIQDNIVYSSEEMPSQLSTLASDATLLVVKQSYNLLQIYTPTDTKTSLVAMDYNPLNYNGQEYSSYNQTVPSKGRLYSNNNLIFARNVYNVTTFNSTTTSTIQIPNTLLNDDTVTQENLISETNSTIVSNSKSINKNIYETLYINFVNTLGVIDEDLGVQYPLAANYINQNINVGTQANCEASFIGKVQIVYESKTVTQNLVWSYDTDHYETSFTIDATGEVPRILFMSNDLSTTYLEKQLDIEVGDYYVINQKLRIE